MAHVSELFDPKTALPVYVIVGEADLFMDRAVNAIKDLVLGGQSLPGFNDDTMDASKVSVHAVRETLCTLPMMSEKRFVWLKHGEALNAESLQILQPYLDAPSSFSCLVMTASKMDARTSLMKSAKQLGYVFEATAPKAHEEKSFVLAEAKRLGVHIEPAALELLLGYVGGDLYLLLDSVERLSLFVGDRKKIVMDDVKHCITKSKVETIWKVVDAVSTKNTKTAMEGVSSLLNDRETPLRILGMLTRQIRMLITMKAALERGLSPDEAGKEAGIPPFKVRETAAQAKKISAGHLRRALIEVAQTDIDIKSSKDPADRRLEKCVFVLCS